MKRQELKINDYKDGTPSIYKLPMTQELMLSKSMIAKQSIGDPGLFQEKVLLMVGATGSGKSTLINGMVNHIMGVKWEDDFRFKVAMDDRTTNYVTAYAFHPMDGSAVPYTFTIIDTPGFGATEGMKRDKEISEQIKKFFSISPPEGIDHLDGIGLVVEASQVRLTAAQQYIFDSIFSIFGKDVSKNIFMMITFADGKRPPVLEAIKKAHIPSQSEHCQFFKFNNSALFAKNSAGEGKLSFDELFWKMGFNSFRKFFVEFPESESVSLQLTKEVLEEREQLQMSLEGLNEQITFGLNKIEEMHQEEIVLQQHEKDIEANKKFTYKVDVTKPHYISLQGTGQHTTTCLPCNYTCHKNCKIADDQGKNKCWAMGEGGRCRVCPRKCIWSEHKNLPHLIEHRVVTETRTQEDLEKKYHEAVLEMATTKQMITSLNKSLLEVHFQVLTKIKQAQKGARRLHEIALKPNPLSEVEYIELLIASERRSTSPGWKERIKYYDVVKQHTIRLSKVKDEEESKKLVWQLSTQAVDDIEEARKEVENLSLEKL